jgi:hypothetical protein
MNAAQTLTVFAYLAAVCAIVIVLSDYWRGRP